MSVGIIVIIIKQRNSFCTKTRDNCDSTKEKKTAIIGTEGALSDAPCSQLEA